MWSLVDSGHCSSAQTLLSGTTSQKPILSTIMILLSRAFEVTYCSIILHLLNELFLCLSVPSYWLHRKRMIVTFAVTVIHASVPSTRTNTMVDHLKPNPLRILQWTNCSTNKILWSVSRFRCFCISFLSWLSFFDLFTANFVSSISSIIILIIIYQPRSRINEPRIISQNEYDRYNSRLQPIW